MRRLSRPIGVVGVLALGMAVGAGAQPDNGWKVAGQVQVRFAGDRVTQMADEIVDPTAPARLAELIAQLSSNDVSIRAAATTKLLQDESFTLRVIEAALKDGGGAEGKLSLEARSRLLTAARDRFARTSRGAMGIQFWANLRDRVVVERTFENFDSSKKLQDGDMIVEADGRAISGPNARNRLQALIVSHEPGETIELVVRRGEKKEKFSVVLGKRENLRDSMMTDEIIQRAWSVRSAAYAPAPVAPITPPIAAAQWPTQPIGQEQINRVQLRRKGVSELGPNIAGGGVPRGASLNLDQINLRGFMQVAGAGGMARRRDRAFNAMFAPGAGMSWDPSVEPAMPAMLPAEELEELARAKVRFQFELDAYRPKPDTGVNEQAALMERIKAIEGAVRIIDKQSAAIAAELTEAGQPVPEVSVPPLERAKAEP